MPKRKHNESASEIGEANRDPNFAPRISVEKPLADYIQLIRRHVQCDKIIPDAVLKSNFDKIASEARDVIWRLLFNGNGDNNSDVKDAAVSVPNEKERHAKAAELLEEHKCDAGFYSPWTYNEWILGVRDELLKREMLDFWRDAMVKKELGPCWAKDSDLFEDLDDPEPAEFYAHAGCVAPFVKSAAAAAAETSEAQTTTTPPTDAGVVSTTSNSTTTATTTTSSENTTDDTESTADFDAKLGDDDPLTDYQELMQRYVRADRIVSDELLAESFKKIAESVRATLWRLLFKSPDSRPTDNEIANAAELLEEHKSDACFYNPWYYNEWIVEFRDELLKRDNLLDFWRDVMVKLELGPCWAKDSDYFDDMEDAEPAAYYAHAGCVAPFTLEDNDAASSEAGDTEPKAAATESASKGAD